MRVTKSWNIKFQKQPPEVFHVKRFSYKFHKIHRKTLVPEACNFIEKETLAQVFSCEFCEISKNIFFTDHLWTTAYQILKYQSFNIFNLLLIV